MPRSMSPRRSLRTTSEARWYHTSTPGICTAHHKIDSHPMRTYHANAGGSWDVRLRPWLEAGWNQLETHRHTAACSLHVLPFDVHLLVAKQTLKRCAALHRVQGTQQPQLLRLLGIRVMLVCLLAGAVRTAATTSCSHLWDTCHILTWVGLVHRQCTVLQQQDCSEQLDQGAGLAEKAHTCSKSGQYCASSDMLRVCYSCWELNF
jgi:hypothetical protein